MSADLTKFPWKWVTMDDRALRIWLMGVAAGLDASRVDSPILAKTEWPRTADGQPDITRLSTIIFLEKIHKAEGMGCAVWWDFDATIRNIRRHFPYTTNAAPLPTLEEM